MDKLLAVVDRLERQAYFEVPAVALDYADAADDVVQDFVAAAVAQWIDPGGVVLQVNPTAHHHRCAKNEGEYFVVGIGGCVVVVQEGAAVEFECGGATARGDDERGVVGQRPLGTYLRDVVGAFANGCFDKLCRYCGEAQLGGAFAASEATRVKECVTHLVNVATVAGWHELQVEERNIVVGCIVESGHKNRVLGDHDTLGRQPLADLWVVEGRGCDTGVHITGVTTTGATVQGGGVGVVSTLATVSADEDETGKVFGETHVAQRSLGEC